MEKHIYRLSSFAKTIGGGNPAGVVLDADGLSEQEMKEIAKEVGYSETAFVMKSNKADFKVLFFTPMEEVDLCGHATIATFNLLRDMNIITQGEYTQETKAGVLKLIVNESEVFMEQNIPTFSERITHEEIASCFESKEQDFIDSSLPIQIVSTGLRDIIVPVRSLDTLSKLKPNHKHISEISKKYDAIGIHAFTLETINNSTAHTRNFAPLYGIDEESATGTANGALAAYLNKYVDSKRSSYVIEQGYSMGRPSEIKVEIKLVDGSIQEVYVGGNALEIK